VSAVAEFLTSRFYTGLQANTVRNYRSAIQAIHRGFADGSSLGESDAIRHLLNGMFIRRPPVRKMVPSWSLSVLLEYLKGPPFEPLASASLLNLTLKTVSLVALASGRRSSEIHALGIEPFLEITRNGATLCFRPNFLAKNERASFTAAPVKLPAIASQSSVAEDRMWCPVRALRYYLKRTKTLRGPTEQLFVITQKPHTPASRGSIARWICKAIVDSGAARSGERVTAHSTRAVACSTAFHKGVSVGEVMDAVSWKSASTFTTTYLRDVPPPRSASFARAVLTRGPLRK
jgi:integrase